MKPSLDQLDVFGPIFASAKKDYPLINYPMIKQFSILFLLIGLLHLNTKSQITFTGKIINATKAPVANASILVLNSNIHSISDSNGHFNIKFPSQGNYQLEINHITVSYTHLTLPTKRIV